MKGKMYGLYDSAIIILQHKKGMGTHELRIFAYIDYLKS
jgi:hypothetical protein